jgi:hypothetical protein
VAVRASRDGAEVSVQEAIVEVNQMTGEPRARFMFPFHNGEQTPFLLVNVAHDAQTTTPIENMPIRFTVVRSYATITSMTGPSGADVDQPLGMVFDNVTPGVLIDAAITRYNYDPRLTEPCVLRKLGLSNARGDGLSFMLDHEGPIGPGEYPVADATQHRYPDPLPPGQVSAAFVLGFLNQPPAQQLQQFVGVAGTLTVQSVSGLLVTGVLDVVGENKRAKLIRQGLEEPPANYLPGAVIRVEFGLVMHDPGDPVNNSAAYDCLSSEASESQAATGSAPTSGRPGGSESDPARDAGGTSSDGARGNAQDDSPQSGTEATFPDSAAGPVRPSKADVASLGPGEARWILVEAEGRSDLSFYGSDVDGSAGAAFSCYGADNPALLSLFKGASAQTAELGLSVITAAGIPEGATGAYRIDQATYLFGGGTLSWRGPASLELSRHDASTDPGARRIVGRIVGLSVLDHQTRAPIPIRAEFDVNAACAPFSPGR